MFMNFNWYCWINQNDHRNRGRPWSPDLALYFRSIPEENIPLALLPEHTQLIIDNRDRAKQSVGWSELWKSDESILWDGGKPSPALIDFIESRSDVQHRSPTGRRLKALVPVSFLSHHNKSFVLRGY